MAVLAITVLIIMIFIFRAQVGRISGGFFEIGDDAREGATGKKCETFFGGRICGYRKGSEYKKGEYEFSLVPRIPCSPEDDKKEQESKGKFYCAWTDCQAKDESKNDCYEIVKIEKIEEEKS